MESSGKNQHHDGHVIVEASIDQNRGELIISGLSPTKAAWGSENLQFKIGEQIDAELANNIRRGDVLKVVGTVVEVFWEFESRHWAPDTPVLVLRDVHAYPPDRT